MTQLRTNLSQARGLGSAKSGTATFIAERLTALALIPLGLWFVVNLLTLLLDGDIGALPLWLKSPLDAAFLALFIVFSFWHSKLGVQVIVEDYIHKPLWRNSLLLLNLAAHILFGLICLMAVFQLHYLTDAAV